jgi:putative ATPase
MEPLASRIRPKDLSEVEGQEHLVGEGKPLRVAIEKKHKFSFILWGPPGTGKTTIARIYAKALDAELYELSAVSAGKDDIRNIVGDSGRAGKLALGKPKVLFLDEIHRFNKSQQDFLLPYVESGELTLIGATTENPSFEVVPARADASSRISNALSGKKRSGIDRAARSTMSETISGERLT